jgi:hypothetical protein
VVNAYLFRQQPEIFKYLSTRHLKFPAELFCSFRRKKSSQFTASIFILCSRQPNGIPQQQAAMGNIFSQSDPNGDSSQSNLKRQSSNNSASASLKQTITQNMRLSKSKVSSLLKANHMNYSIVHRNHFYNTLPHVRHPPSDCLCPINFLAHRRSIPIWSSAAEIIRYLRWRVQDS